MAIQYMVFLPRGLRVRYLYLVFVTRNGDSCVVFPLCVRQARPRVWRSQLAWCGQWSCGIVCVVCDCVCAWCGGQWSCGVLTFQTTQRSIRCVRACAHSFQHEKIHAMPAVWCLFFKICSTVQLSMARWSGGVCDLQMMHLFFLQFQLQRRLHYVSEKFYSSLQLLRCPTGFKP